LVIFVEINSSYMKSTEPSEIRLLADRLIVKPEDLTGKKTAGGIYIPDSATKEEGAQIGTVINIAPQIVVHNEEHPKEAVNLGDVVIFSKFAGADLKHSSQAYSTKDYKVLRITDIHGVI